VTGVRNNVVMTFIDEHAMPAERPTIGVPDVGSVSRLLLKPRRPLACYVMAHGAGAGMTHPFMEAVAMGLADRHVATLRFQFPSMEHGLKRPDRPAVAMTTVRATVSRRESSAETRVWRLPCRPAPMHIAPVPVDENKYCQARW
jgi:hypothetical protein